MITNVSEYLDLTAEKYPSKTAFIDDKKAVTFAKLQENVYQVASGILSYGLNKQPIAVYLDKSVECVEVFIGIAKSGNFYSPIDTRMPYARIEKIINTLNPAMVITDEKHKNDAMKFFKDRIILIFEEIKTIKINYQSVKKASNAVLDSDLLYVLFTSGSTGTPKGVMIAERGVIDFVEWATERFAIDDSYVFGNQSPFYFSFSIYEIYLTVRNGATTYIIPHELFSYPADLMKYVYDRKINTLVWVPSALCMISAFKALNTPHLDELKNVWFGAEVMPTKQLNRWRTEYPDVRFVNLFGPTEVTDTCSAYEIDRVFKDTEMLPIGEACKNKEILLLNEEGQRVKDDGIGELCVRGTGLAYGYYNDPLKTAEVFVQNPLNTVYPEIIYKTGDLAKYNKQGELIYISRKDFQIKHMGHRIELGEIEAAASSIEGVELCCCLYDTNKSKIVLFYSGNVDEKLIVARIKELLPEYMIPNKQKKIKEMPFNLNGKIDRVKLKDLL